MSADQFIPPTIAPWFCYKYLEKYKVKRQKCTWLLDRCEIHNGFVDDRYRRHFFVNAFVGTADTNVKWNRDFGSIHFYSAGCNFIGPFPLQRILQVRWIYVCYSHKFNGNHSLRSWCGFVGVGGCGQLIARWLWCVPGEFLKLEAWKLSSEWTSLEVWYSGYGRVAGFGHVSRQAWSLRPTVQCSAVQYTDLLCVNVSIHVP